MSLEIAHRDHRVVPLDGNEDTFRCGCGTVFTSRAGPAVCPDDPTGWARYESVAEGCLHALHAIGKPATSEEILGWLTQHGADYRLDQVRGAVHSLTRRRPPAAEIAGRSAAGKGRPAQWRIAREWSGTGWPDQVTARLPQ